MNELIKKKLATYPAQVAEKLRQIRVQILLAAKEHNLTVVESLKWGEPSIGAKGGSAVRYDWKVKDPCHYCVYFNCQTILVETFKVIYGELFKFEGHRAMVFEQSETIPWPAFRHCVSMSLQYQKLKHLPLLGA